MEWGEAVRIDLYKHFGPPYLSWVAHIPHLDILLEYQCGFSKPIIYTSRTPNNDAEPCSDLEFLVLFGVSLEDIKKEVGLFG